MDIEPTPEEKAMQMWVLTSGTPKSNRGNGLHDWYCDTFRQRDKYPPRRATSQEMDELHSCGKCGGNKPREIVRKCPTHHLVLSANGVCDECDQQ
jgi:hypothetical protein